jgi:uncharacterized protein
MCLRSGAQRDRPHAAIVASALQRCQADGPGLGAVPRHGGPGTSRQRPLERTAGRALHFRPAAASSDTRVFPGNLPVSRIEFSMSNPAYDPRYLQGIQYFNDCDFFEAHEVWEELWTEYQGPARRYYQGLIQAAVCLHHFGNENVRGARKLYHSCRKYLEEYLPHYEGLNLEVFLQELERCCHKLLEADVERTTVTICADLIPEIHLQSAAGDA